MRQLFQALFRRKLLLLSLLANICLLAACFYLLSYSKETYKHYRHYRALAIGTSEATAAKLSEIPNDKLNVVLFGDSRIETWHPKPVTNRYHFFNAGISGETTTEMLRRFEIDVIRLKPDYVVIQTGMNDLTASVTRTISAPEKYVETMHDNLRYFISTLESQGVEVIVTSIIPNKPLSLFRRAFWHNDLSDKVRIANSNLEKATISLGADWFDLDSFYLDTQGEIKESLYFDTLHINEEGYEVLNQKIIEYLDQLTTKTRE